MKLPQLKPHRQLLGKKGEDQAVRYLKSRGYSILDRNFRAGYGEIDIIATIDSMLVFIEVKARENTRYGYPEEAVTGRKLREVVKAAEYYALLHPKLPVNQRVDVISILYDGTGNQIRFRHIENVTL